MKTTLEELENFHQFALKLLSEGEAEQSLGELLTLWQATREREEANAGIRRGLDAVAEGRTQPVHEFLAEFRESRHS